LSMILFRICSLNLLVFGAGDLVGSKQFGVDHEFHEGAHDPGADKGFDSAFLQKLILELIEHSSQNNYNARGQDQTETYDYYYFFLEVHNVSVRIISFY
jgi:hypothetical protein